MAGNYGCFGGEDEVENCGNLVDDASRHDGAIVFGLVAFCFWRFMKIVT